MEMMALRRIEINGKAEAIHAASRRYHLAHAMDACARYIAKGKQKTAIQIIFSQNVKESSVWRHPRNNLTIFIPEALLNKSLDEKALPGAVHELRKNIGHELGHAVLHFEKIPVEVSEKNSMLPEEEDEADYFSEKLLALRKTTLQAYCRQGVSLKL